MSEKSVRIVAVGDIFLGEHPVTLGHGVRTIARRNGCGFLFEKVFEYLKAGDIVCGNLEGIISPKLKNETGVRSEIFWGEPSCAKVIKEAGFNCLFLANNHNAQHGKDALQRTCILLDNYDIKWTGFNPDDPRTPIPAIFQVNGLTVAMSAYCETQQYHLDTPVLPIIKIENIEREIKKLKKQCDIVVISLHWGDEFINYPSPSQIELAHKIIDSGANLILGHHAHTMQGIEQYNNGLIAYSLGSFIKDLWPRKLRESTILQCELFPSGVKNVNLVPIIIHKKNHRPEFFQGSAGDKYLSGVQRLSRNLENQSLIDSGLQQKKYLKDVKKLLFRDRMETLLHYLFNILRYDKKLLLENWRLMINRRIAGRNM